MSKQAIGLEIINDEPTRSDGVPDAGPLADLVAD